jgi:hypothetical protein
MARARVAKNKKHRGGEEAAAPRFTNKRSMTRTRRYAQNLGVYLGLNITPEMHAELVESGKDSNMRQSDFARVILKEGLRVWKATQDAPYNGKNPFR